MKALFRGLIACAAMAVAACGGGGGGDSGGGAGESAGGGGDAGGGAPGGPVVITSANQQRVSRVALSVFASGGAPETSIGVQTSAVTHPSVSDALKIVTRKAREARMDPQRVVGVIVTKNCDVSGTRTIDASDDLTRMTITYNNCSKTPGESKSGTMTATGITQTATTFTATMTMDVIFSEAGSPDMRMHGGFSASETCDSTGSNCTLKASGSSLTVIETGVDTLVISNFSLTDACGSTRCSETVNFTVASNRLGGSVTVATVTPFVTLNNATNPQSGVMTVTGAGSAVRIAVNSSAHTDANAITVQLDANNDGTFESSTNYSWAQLEAA